MKPTASHFVGMPATRAGWWSIRLAGVFVVMFIANVLILSFADESLWRQTALPFYAPLMLLCGLTSGIIGIIAVTCQREHSSLVWLSIGLGAFVLLLVVNELLQLVGYLQGH